MFILFGMRSKAKVLARLLLVCGFCNQPAAQTLIQRQRWFTLFFVPVLPISKKHLVQCAMCGHVTEVSKEETDRLVAQAQAPAVETIPAESA